jgi:hypothetical protein
MQFFVRLTFLVLFITSVIKGWRPKFERLQSFKFPRVAYKFGKFNQMSHTALKFRVADDREEMTATKSKPRQEKISKPPKFEEIENDDNDEQAEVLLNRLSKGIIPIAASLGFAVTPSSTLVARFAGAAAGGLAGFLAKKAIDKSLVPVDRSTESFLDDGSTSALSNALNSFKDPSKITDYGPQALEIIAKKFELKNEDLGYFFTYVLSNAIYEAIRGNEMDLTQLSNIIEYIENGDFSKSEIGDALSLVAIKLGKEMPMEENGFYSPEFNPQLFLEAAKLLFLTDKLFNNMDGFYGKRTSLGLTFFTLESYQALLTEVCAKIFRHTVDTILENPELLNREEMQSMTKFLTTSTPEISSFRISNMQNLIMRAILFRLNKELDRSSDSITTPPTTTETTSTSSTTALTTSSTSSSSSLSSSGTISTSTTDITTYLKAEKVFGWSTQETMNILETKTLPIFEQDCKVLLDLLVEKPEIANQHISILRQRAKSLGIPATKARTILISLLNHYNKDYINRISKVYERHPDNLNPIFKLMMAYGKTYKAFSMVTNELLSTGDIPIPSLPVSKNARQLLFEWQIDPSSYQNQRWKSKIPENFFDLSETEQLAVKQSLVFPKIFTWIKQCLTERNFNRYAQQAYEKYITEYGLDELSWQATIADWYYEEVKKISDMRAIPSNDDIQYLNEIQQFLKVKQDDIEKIHLELFGVKYIKALTEAMTPSMTISPEYIDGLHRLRDRLQLTNENALKLVSIATRQRMIPMIQDLCDVWKSHTDYDYRIEKQRKEQQDEQQKQKQQQSSSSNPNISKLTSYAEASNFGFLQKKSDGKSPAVSSTTTTSSSSSGDNTINTFMRDTMNLIDIVQSTYQVHEIYLDELSTSYITAADIIPEVDLIGMFKYFVMNRISEPDESLRTRYESVETLLAKLLGIPMESLPMIKESLAYTAFKRFLLNGLKEKDLFDTSDLQQFAYLQRTLPLETSAATYIFQDSCQHALLEHFSTLLSIDISEQEEEIQKLKAHRKLVKNKQIVDNGLDDLKAPAQSSKEEKAAEERKLKEKNRKKELKMMELSMNPLTPLQARRFRIQVKL